MIVPAKNGDKPWVIIIKPKHTLLDIESFIGTDTAHSREGEGHQQAPLPKFLKLLILALSEV